MATDWTNPRQITQYAESGAENIHIRWDDSNGFSDLKSANSGSVGTLEKLLHIARSPKPDINSKTYYLKLTNYIFSNLPDTISGIELRINSRRAGRITDDTVTLALGNQFLGDNQANLEINPIKIYGGEQFLWGLRNISKETLQDESFGVVVRFKSHPHWPHSDPMDLISVQLRIH
jgi:hypothetical protein